jgi:hypothetical protein
MSTLLSNLYNGMPLSLSHEMNQLKVVLHPVIF